MIYTSPLGKFNDIPNGNAVTGFLSSPYLQDKSVTNKPFFVDSVTGEAITIGQYKRLVPRTAAILQNEYGIKQGDVVALFGINHMFTPAIHHGTLSLGATLSPANIMYSAEELKHQLVMTKPKIIIVFDPVVKIANDAIKLANAPITVVTFSVLFQKFKLALSNQSAPEIAPIYLDNKKSHAYYCFSSGTSGLPKGVITTHYNIMANTIQMILANSPYFGPKTSQSCVLPMSHIFALNTAIWCGPYTGKKTVIFPKFDIEDFVAGVCKYKTELLILVPPIIQGLGKLPVLDKYPEFGEVVEMICSGAAPLSKETIGFLTKKCPKIKVSQGYGLTETTPITHIGAIQEIEKYDPASVGWLVPGTEAMLVDPDNGKPVEGFRKRGELWLRGPMLMAGYLHNQQATDECITKDKWFKTGDVAIVTESQQFYIVDRIKELIKSNGHQVAPAELESILLTNPNVLDVAVIGVYNRDKTTENPRAYLVLIKGTDPKEVLKWFNKRVAKHKRLWGGCVIVDVIPKSASGKILRKDLRARAAEDTNVVVGAELASL